MDDAKFKPGIGLQIRIFLTSLIVFGVIAGILALIMASMGVSGSQSIFFWLVFSLIIIGIQWWLGPYVIKLATGAKEIKQEDAPEIYQMVKNLASKAGLPMPKLYIVEDRTPNAFAFGRTKSDSAIALHRGILSYLDKQELEAVIAHELGHINNRDVAVMTLASVLPVILYYGVLIFFPRRDERGGGSLLAFFGAFIARFIGELCVLWLSRQREYFADEFSARITNRPLSLISALVKISYGAALQKREASESMIKALYFAEPQNAKIDMQTVAKAIAAGNEKALIDALENERKMGGFELLMTHPLTVKRVENLIRVKRELGA
jgi:heat shock protein HtpX